MAVTILLADDDKPTRQAIEMFLETEGYRVIVAADGWDCLAQLDKRPDLILLDINMPKMGGLDALAVIRAHALTQTVPVVVLSGDADGELLVKASRQPGVSFLKKPFTPKALHDRLAGVIFRADFSKLQKEVLPNLGRRDATLFRQPGLTAFGDSDWEAYSLSFEGHELCLLLTKGKTPTDFLLCTEAEAVGQLMVFRKFGGDWKGIWPPMTGH